MARPTRLKALEHQTARLERRIASLEALDRRFSWIRLGALLAGGVVTWAAASWAGGPWGWAALGLSLAGFAAVVALHRRLDRWSQTFKIWLELKAAQLARMRLDWDSIPPPVGAAQFQTPGLSVDLDLTGPRSLHHLMDTAVSQAGSERLAAWLSQADPQPEVVQRRQAVVSELAQLSRFRDRFQLTYRLVSAGPLAGERLLGWLQVADPASRLGWLLPVAAALTSLNLALFSLNSLGLLPPYWILTFFVYLIFYFYNTNSLQEFLDAVVDLDRELGPFRALLEFLETYPYRSSSRLHAICRPFVGAGIRPSRQLQAIKLTTAAIGLRMNPVMSFVLNAMLPWDFAFAFLANRRRQRMAGLLPVWLDTLYTLEALTSLANFAYLNPGYTFPEFTSDASPILQARQLGHPLLPPDSRVCNSFEVAEAGSIAIITGSNMAGKSTFIKTVGINLCLAYAGGPVNAASWSSAPFRLHTCIRISDSITDGLSYFYAEVRCLKRLLEELEAESPFPLLFLIDEIFRGTNNQERLIGSRAYLQSLEAANGIGLVATHDLELTGLAAGRPWVKNYHFRDHIHAGRMAFDYRLHPGPSPTTNALKIMALEGLPVEPGRGPAA